MKFEVGQLFKTEIGKTVVLNTDSENSGDSNVYIGGLVKSVHPLKIQAVNSLELRPDDTLLTETLSKRQIIEGIKNAGDLNSKRTQEIYLKSLE